MASADPEPLAAVAKGINDFTVGLYLATAKSKAPTDNLLVSPLSAGLVTAMVHEGAKGNTSDEIVKALHLPADKGTRDSGLSALYDQLSKTKDVILDVANQIYVEKTTTLKEDFVKAVQGVHRSAIEKADFIGNHDGERVKINDWVSNSTHNKINDLLQPGSLDNSARLVLVNAVYFNGKWKERFAAHETHPEDFYVTPSKPVKVQMMHMSKTIRYADIPELNAKAVELRYAGDEVAMQIILPNDKDGLPSLEEKLKDFDLSKIEFYSTRVHLSLPKFKIESTIDLKEVFQKMGMTTMFTDSADFSNMANEKLKVSKAVQKTFMDVDEEGTEAAAATACVGRRKRCVEELPLEFFVDHPFFFKLIHHDIILFLGCVSEPPVVEDDDLSIEDEILERKDARSDIVPDPTEL